MKKTELHKRGGIVIPTAINKFITGYYTRVNQQVLTNKTAVISLFLRYTNCLLENSSAQHFTGSVQFQLSDQLASVVGMDSTLLATCNSYGGQSSKSFLTHTGAAIFQ